jgi:DNA-binding NarL/FixJ family response regulator
MCRFSNILAVRNYLSKSIAKLGVTNRIEAARLAARQRGWL